MVGPGRLRSFAHPTQESDLPQLIVGRSAGLGIMSPGFVSWRLSACCSETQSSPCHGYARGEVQQGSAATAPHDSDFV